MSSRVDCGKLFILQLYQKMINEHKCVFKMVFYLQSGDEIKVFPACVDQLLGKTWVVRFKHRIQMHQSSVLDFSEQEHHIQSVIFTLGLQVIIICPCQCNSQMLKKNFLSIYSYLQDEQCLSNKSAAVGAASSSQQDYHPTVDILFICLHYLFLPGITLIIIVLLFTNNCYLLIIYVLLHSLHCHSHLNMILEMLPL